MHKVGHWPLPDSDEPEHAPLKMITKTYDVTPYEEDAPSARLAKDQHGLEHGFNEAAGPRLHCVFAAIQNVNYPDLYHVIMRTADPAFHVADRKAGNTKAIINLTKGKGVDGATAFEILRSWEAEFERADAKSEIELPENHYSRFKRIFKPDESKTIEFETPAVLPQAAVA